jgi:hypothetical protein
MATKEMGMKRKHVAPVLVVFLALLLNGFPAVTLQAARTPGVSLPRIDAATVDESLQSYNSMVPARINFVNHSTSPVDIYWINYEGRRVQIEKQLPMNGTHTERTYLTHPFLVVASGTGGTLETGSGLRLWGFVALTTNGDTANITN